MDDNAESRDNAAEAVDPTAELAADATSVIRTRAEDGTPLHGDGLPLNRRLRAEELAKAGKAEDEAGIVSAELIAATGDRLAAEERAAEEARRAEEKAHPPVRATMKTADLERIARREGVDLGSATNNQERVDAIEAKRAQTSTEKES